MVLRARIAVLFAGAALLAASCTSDGTGDVAPTEVDPTSAYIAIVEWQASEQEPVVNDSGETQLPVIYVVAADGTTIDVGVQAAVAGATVDIATVRFADEAGEAFDSSLEDEPVREHGSMLLVGLMPAPAPTVTVDVVRFAAIEDSEPMQITIKATPQDTTGLGRAVVTSVTPP